MLKELKMKAKIEEKWNKIKIKKFEEESRKEQTL